MNNESYSNVKINIDASFAEILNEDNNENAQTTVFCNYISKTIYTNGGWINIYPTTYLVCEMESLPLLHAFNVPVAPEKFHFEKAGQHKRFALIFPPVPKIWKTFSFLESCPHDGGFYYENIKRNDSGIYEINIK
jgi:hypothetical protein